MNKTNAKTKPVPLIVLFIDCTFHSPHTFCCGAAEEADSQHTGLQNPGT